MPIHVVERDTSTGYRCLCSECGTQGLVSRTIEEALYGFYPADVDQAFSGPRENAIYLCTNCHLRHLALEVPPPRQIEQLLIGHFRRASPEVSVVPGSLARAVIQMIAYSRLLTTEQLVDEVDTLLRLSPENRERLAGVTRRFLEGQRDRQASLAPLTASLSPTIEGERCVEEFKKVLKLPEPVPDWCVDGSLVKSRDGLIFRVLKVTVNSVILDGGDRDHTFFSRYETFAKFFELVEPPSVWDLLVDEGDDDLLGAEDLA